jgi:glycine C-acetyltransferase
MAYPAAIHDALEAELQSLREKGIFKEERLIHSPQSAEIDVEFPRGAAPKRVINLCSNNYLGLSSHPEVVASAHAATACRACASSAGRRTSTAGSRRS